MREQIGWMLSGVASDKNGQGGTAEPLAQQQRDVWPHPAVVNDLHYWVWPALG